MISKFSDTAFHRRLVGSQVAGCGMKTAFSPACSAGLMSVSGLFPTIQPLDFTILNCSIRRWKIPAFFSMTIFNRVEIGLQAGALDFARLFRGFALGQQDQAVALGEICQRFRHSFENLRRRVFEFGGHLLDFLHHFAARHVSSELQIGFFERTAEAAHAIAVLADVAPLGFVENVPDVVGRVAEIFELAKRNA